MSFHAVHRYSPSTVTHLHILSIQTASHIELTYSYQRMVLERCSRAVLEECMGEWRGRWETQRFDAQTGQGDYTPVEQKHTEQTTAKVIVILICSLI